VGLQRESFLDVSAEKGKGGRSPWKEGLLNHSPKPAGESLRGREKKKEKPLVLYEEKTLKNFRLGRCLGGGVLLGNFPGKNKRPPRGGVGGGEEGKKEDKESQDGGERQFLPRGVGRRKPGEKKEGN